MAPTANRDYNINYIEEEKRKAVQYNIRANRILGQYYN
jgi:hypothetical protein